MHLHGHDFAILQESNSPFSPEIFSPNLNNPPRRDVVIVQNGGFVAIAFKTDNPGTWLMHCHIAFHASIGLALQILERQADANVIWPPLASHALTEARRVCANWNSWTRSEEHTSELQSRSDLVCRLLLEKKKKKKKRNS